MAIRTGPTRNWAVALVMILACLSHAQSGARRYKVIELPLKPLHLNNSGQIVGTTDKNRAATWSQRAGLRVLPVLEGFPESEARGSNQRGHVVGFFRNAAGSRAFVHRNGKLVVLSGDHAKALAVNDSDQIAGESDLQGKTPVSAVFWKNESITNLGGCCGGVARGINNRGQIIGDVYDLNGRYRAVLWDASHNMQYLGPDNSYSSAVAMNDSGHVVVQELEKGLYLYLEPGKRVRVDIPNQQAADARAVNHADQVVGGYGPFFDAYRAFVWSEKNGFRDLNDLIPTGSGWKLQLATGINDKGEIVGFGDHNGKDDVGFLLVEEEAASKAGSMR